MLPCYPVFSILPDHDFSRLYMSIMIRGRRARRYPDRNIKPREGFEEGRGRKREDRSSVA